MFSRIKSPPWSLLWMGILAGISLLSSSLVAEEPCEKFLEGLRDRGYFDVAMDYLERMESSPLSTQEFKLRIPLEKVETLTRSTQQIRDPRETMRVLEQAQGVLDQYLNSNPPSKYRSEAETTRATLRLGHARLLIERAKNDRLTRSEKDALRADARKLLTDAGKAFESYRNQIRRELENFDQTQTGWRSRKKTLENEYVQVRLMAPVIKERIADSYDPSNAQRGQLLREAAREYAELSQKYRTREGGLDAALYAARCHSKMKQFDDALAILVTDIFNQDDDPGYYELKKRAAILALDCWESKDPLPHNEMLQYLTPVMQSLKPSQLRQPQVLRLQLAYAQACKSKADQIRNDRPSSSEQRALMNELERTAVQYARAVSRVPGTYREAARQALFQWNERVVDSAKAETKEPPESLEDARERGKDLLVEVENLQALIAAGQIPAPEQTATQTKIRETTEKALDLFRTALLMAPPDAVRDDITNLRYLQSYCYYQLGQFEETTLIGRFMVARFPGNSGVRQSMELVCKSLWQRYLAQQDDDRSYELDQLKASCKQVLELWPGSRESETAARLMTVISLKEKQPAEAEYYLELIPENSKARADIELNLGNLMWKNCLQEKTSPSGKYSTVELDQMAQKAKTLLQRGVGGLTTDGLTRFQADVTLSLIEIYLDEGDVDAALEQLESATVAPLDLVKQKHPVTQDSTFRIATYQTAIRTYLGALQKGTDSAIWIEKADGVLAALRDEMQSIEDGKRKLVATYFRLAKQLKLQFDNIESNDQKSTFASGLERFLTAIANESSDSELLYWCGSTLASVGQALKEAELIEDSKRFFGKSVKVLQDAQSAIDRDPNASTALKIQFKRQRAMSLRGMGRYDESVKMFADLLKTEGVNGVATIQVEAAETLAEWGASRNDSSAFQKALMGTEKYSPGEGKRPTNAIWGWIRLYKVAKATRKEDLLTRSIYNMAQCKIAYAELTEKKNVLDSARNDIKAYQKHNPNLAVEWKNKFNSLLRRIGSE